jgi:hypothetical protein
VSSNDHVPASCVSAASAWGSQTLGRPDGQRHLDTLTGSFIDDKQPSLIVALLPTPKSGSDHVCALLHVVFIPLLKGGFCCGLMKMDEAPG